MDALPGTRGSRVLRLAILACMGIAPGCPREPGEPTGGLVVVNPVGDRPTFFDLGNVLYGQPAGHVFRIRNDDPVPVTVRDVLPSCGCAQPRISYAGKDGQVVRGDTLGRDAVITLPPRTVADLEVEIDTERVEVMNRDKLAQVRLRTDSKTTPYLTFEIHLLVTRAMRAVPPRIELGQTAQSGGKGGRADVSVDILGTKSRVLGIETIEGPFTATVDPTEVAGVPLWIVVATPKPNLEVGPATGTIVLAVSGADGTGTGPPFRLPVTAQIAPDVVLRPPVLAFGTIARGKGAEIPAELVALVPGERVRVLSTRVTATPESVAPEISVEAVPAGPGDDGRAETWRVVLRASEKLAEPAFSGIVTIALDHPRVPEVRVPFSGVTR